MAREVLPAVARPGPSQCAPGRMGQVMRLSMALSAAVAALVLGGAALLGPVPAALAAAVVIDRLVGAVRLGDGGACEADRSDVRAAHAQASPSGAGASGRVLRYSANLAFHSAFGGNIPSTG